MTAEEAEEAEEWSVTYRMLLGQVETAYHQWALAAHLASETTADIGLETQHIANVYHNHYNRARSEFYTWVTEHPAPDGARFL